MQDLPAAKSRDTKKTKPPAKRRSSRKAAYRPLQSGLVVASFVASFMGATWLQAQDRTAESVQSNVAVVAESPASLAILAPTPPPVVPAMPQAEAESSEVAAAETSAGAALSVPEVVLPTTTPVPAPTAVPSLAPTTRVPKVVARSRSSR